LKLESAIRVTGLLFVFVGAGLFTGSI
jgi:hypothetical protein